MSDLTTRLRAFGIEPGEGVCDYELRAQESNLIPRLSADAALDELMTVLEAERELLLRVKTEADRVCSLEQGAAECAEKRAERAEAEVKRLLIDRQKRSDQLHLLLDETESAKTMWRERGQKAEAEALRVEKAAARISEEKELAEAKLARAETAFGILSDLHPEEAKEAWRKAGELGGGGA